MIPTEYLITKEREKEARREKAMWAVVIAVIIAAVALIVNEGFFAGRAIAYFLETMGV